MYVHVEETIERNANKEFRALPWSPELGRDKLLEIKYFISFSRILRHNVHFGHTRELSQLVNIILDILSQLQTLYKDHSVKKKGWLFLRHSAWLSLILSLLQAGLWKVSLRKIPVSREEISPFLLGELTICKYLQIGKIFANWIRGVVSKGILV